MRDSIFPCLALIYFCVAWYIEIIRYCWLSKLNIIPFISFNNCKQSRLSSISVKTFLLCSLDYIASKHWPHITEYNLYLFSIYFSIWATHPLIFSLYMSWSTVLLDLVDPVSTFGWVRMKSCSYFSIHHMSPPCLKLFAT